MAFENIAFESITISHIQALIDNGVREGLLIEYKQSLSAGSDDEKREFLADISSFANTRGGHILFGLAEERGPDGRATGVPQTIPGIELTNADAEIRRLENLIRDSISPRIAGIRCRVIAQPPAHPVLVISIPRSQGAPHAVTFKGILRFYCRNSAGKYPLDVPEIRSAFVNSHQRVEEIKRFRIDRVSKIIAGDTPIAIPPGPRIILHLIPFISDYDIAPSAISDRRSDISPLYSSGHNSKFNLDGFVTFNKGTASYAQVFRSGALETVSGYLIRDGGEQKIPSTAIEEELISTVERLSKLLGELGVMPPLAVMVTLTGVRGFTMAVHPRYIGRGEPIDRDELFLPEIVMNELDNTDRALRIILDALWNSAGWRQSLNYDEDGNWTSGR